MSGMINNKSVLLSFLIFVLSGCASVPMAVPEASTQVKKFEAPKKGNAGIYIYRTHSILGSALKKDIHIDNQFVGSSAPGVFFYQEVEGNKPHIVETESEFSPNELTVQAEEGSLYFIKQYIKMGVFVHGADVKLVDDETGKAEVLKTEMALSR